MAQVTPLLLVTIVAFCYAGTMTEDKPKQLHIRMDRELHRFVRIYAAEKDLSINAALTELLELGYQAAQRKKFENYNC